VLKLGMIDILNITKNITKKQFTVLVGVVVGVLVITILLIWIYASVMPRKVTLAVRSSGGFSYQFAVDFKKAMKQATGIDIEIKETTGSVENMKLLGSPNSGVDLAIVNTGAANPDDYPSVVALAGVYYLPYWVWYRPDAFKEGLTSINQLKGKRFAVGPLGSGEDKLSRDILNLNEIKDGEITLLNLSFAQEFADLTEGKIDAVALVDGLGSPGIDKYKDIKGIKIMNFSEAEAYARALPSLTKIALPQSNASFKNHLPDQDIQLISTKAVILARSNINPGLVNEIMGVLFDNKFRNYSRLQNLDEFPSNQALTFPLQGDAEIYMKDGPTFLYRHLPAWLAVWVGRILEVLIPLAILIFPLWKIVPKLLYFPWRFTMGKAYLNMKHLELEVFEALASKRPKADFDLFLKDLGEIEIQVNQLKVPAMDTEEYFKLKGHINSLRTKIKSYQST